jgi:hypothetical protein
MPISQMAFGQMVFDLEMWSHWLQIGQKTGTILLLKQTLKFIDAAFTIDDVIKLFSQQFTLYDDKLVRFDMTKF